MEIDQLGLEEDKEKFTVEKFLQIYRDMTDRAILEQEMIFEPQMEIGFH